MPTPSPSATAAGTCTIVGPLLSPTDFGVAAGLPVADSSAVRLADGRVRLYIFAQGRGVVSAVSLTPEGASFVAKVDGPLFEHACHEGNNGIVNMLEGARAQEKAGVKPESR